MWVFSLSFFSEIRPPPSQFQEDNSWTFQAGKEKFLIMDNSGKQEVGLER